MPKKREPAEHWGVDPEEHDFPAAQDYLSLILSTAAAEATVARLRVAGGTTRKAKDLLRAASLPLLPLDDPAVAKELRRVARGEALSPVLLVRGRAREGIALIIADGYHRICASYHLNEDADIPCRLAELDPADAEQAGPASPAP